MAFAYPKPRCNVHVHYAPNASGLFCAAQLRFFMATKASSRLAPHNFATGVCTEPFFAVPGDVPG
jgi:hypothetical protein